MPKQTITLFMWGYQPHFRSSIQMLARNVLKSLGVDVEATALLVGARRPGCKNPHPVCVEPEDGAWPISMFDGLLEAVESGYSNHRLQTMCYGDEPSNRDKPEAMRRDSVSTAVRAALVPYDTENGLRSFCGAARLVDDYYVTPVIQVPEVLFRKFPPLNDKPAKHEFISTGYRSVIEAALATVLAEASAELQLPEPGRSTFGNMRASDEIIRIAATAFMHTPGLAISDQYGRATDLYARLNLISSLLYEGAQGVGRLILANPDNPDIEYLMRFQKPVPFREPRWARKVLQLSAPNAVLVADGEHVYGLGRLRPTHDAHAQNIFTVDFLDHYHWELRCGALPLLRSHYGEPTLPGELIDPESFKSNLERLFPASTGADRAHLFDLFNAAARQDRGSMIVVAEDASTEAWRLALQGTGIEPVKLTVELLQQATAIDGTILLDPQGTCHAIGVILDGEVNDECKPSRGSRFNSAVRYVRSSSARRLAIIVSDDRTVDVFPVLRPRISLKDIARHVAALSKATIHNYRQPVNWLELHRFYLNERQCAEVNVTLDRLDAVPLEVGELRFSVNRFAVDPTFDQSYLTE
jgi:hypothetical protein